MEITITDPIEGALIKENITEAVIASLKEKYSLLTIKDHNDKQGYALVVAGRKECKSIRVMAEKICKKGREEAVSIQKKWIAKEKDVAGRIGEIETSLQEKETAFDNYWKEVEAEKERQEILKQQSRVEALINLKVAYNPVIKVFSLGEISIEEIFIKGMADPDFESLTVKFLNEAAQIERKKEEETRIANELLEAQKLEREGIEKQRLENERLANELKEKQEKIDAENARIEKEKQDNIEQAAKDLWDKRTGELKALGMRSDEEYEGFIFDGGNLDNASVTDEEIIALEDVVWSGLLEGLHESIEKIKEAKEKARAEELETARLKGIREEKERQEHLRIQAELDAKNLAKAKADKEEKERIKAEKKAAKLPDETKLKEYLACVFSIPMPVLKDTDAKLLWNELHAEIEVFIEKYKNKIEKL